MHDTQIANFEFGGEIGFFVQFPTGSTNCLSELYPIFKLIKSKLSARYVSPKYSIWARAIEIPDPLEMSKGTLLQRSHIG